MNAAAKKYRHELKWAIRLSIMSAIWLLVQYVSGLHSSLIEWHPIVGLSWYVFAFLVFHFSLKELKSAEGDTLDFWKGVQSVTMIAVMAVPLHLILNIVYFSTIGSVFFESAVAHFVEVGWDAEEAGYYFSLPAILFRETLGIISFGFIISLISSMFLKNK